MEPVGMRLELSYLESNTTHGLYLSVQFKHALLTRDFSRNSLRGAFSPAILEHVGSFFDCNDNQHGTSTAYING
jgi:hypothetical protein